MDQKIKFPIASIIIILAPIFNFFSIRGAIGFPDMLLLIGASLLINIFVAVVLLLKKRGVLLTIAVCAWAGISILAIARQIMILHHYIRPQNVIVNMLNVLSYFLIIGLAVYCNYHKNPKNMAGGAKLWFIPCIISVLATVIQLPNIMHAMRISYQSSYGFILPSLLTIASFFFLGYWIPYIYSVEPTPKKAPNVRNETLPSNDTPPTVTPTPPQSFCESCGARVTPGSAFCPSCGSKLASHAATPASNGNTNYIASGYVYDAPSTGFAVLSFFFPVVGLILYLVWRESLPLRAKSAGKGSIIGVISYVALIIIIYALYFAFLMSLFS